MTVYGVFGAGGYGREVLPLVRYMTSDADQVYFIVDDAYLAGQSMVNGNRILGISEFLKLEVDKKFFTIAIGSPITRRRVSEKLYDYGLQAFTVRASSHIGLDSNSIGVGSIFSHFTHITSNTEIGEFFHCNLYSYVGHDCRIGNYVTFAPAVKCNGNVVIEDDVYVGAGAIIRDGSDRPIVIGKGAVIGMGAVVTKSVAAGATVVGSPARPIR